MIEVSLDDFLCVVGCEDAANFGGSEPLVLLRLAVQLYFSSLGGGNITNQNVMVQDPPFTIMVDVVQNIQQSFEPNLKSHLLLHLPPDRVLNFLPHLHDPPGESPLPPVWLVVSLYEKDRVTPVNQGSRAYHGERRIFSFSGHSQLEEAHRF